MKLKQRSQIALISSIGIHLVLLIALSILGAFSILDKKDKPVEIVFFDSVNAGSSSSGAVAQPKSEQQTAQANTATDPQAIADSSAKSQSDYTTPSVAVPSAGTEGSGSDSGVGSGSGTGSGDGDGTGSGSGSGISNNPAVPPRVARYVAPDYPAAARSAGITGVVRLQVLISSEGSVQDVEVYESSGNTALDSAAIRAVRSWQFTAAKDGAGRRVACYTIVPIRFNLKS